MIERSFLKGAGIGEPLRISNSCQGEVDKEGILGKKKGRARCGESNKHGILGDSRGE